MLAACAFAFPNAVANVVMVASTCFAVSLILVALLLKLERGRIYGVGALPPLIVAMIHIPNAVVDLPGVFWRSLGITNSGDPSDPFANSGYYSNFFSAAIAMHLLAGVIGYATLLAVSVLRWTKGEPSRAPEPPVAGSQMESHRRRPGDG